MSDFRLISCNSLMAHPNTTAGRGQGLAGLTVSVRFTVLGLRPLYGPPASMMRGKNRFRQRNRGLYG